MCVILTQFTWKQLQIARVARKTQDKNLQLQLGFESISKGLLANLLG